jgi:hypothetical protein
MTLRPKTVSDQASLAALLDRWGVQWSVFTSHTPDFMNDKALKAGAGTCISVRGLVDFYFTKRGRFIGSATYAAKSWAKRRSRK